ncbi:MAG: D-erythrose 4-phosphate dehydrogenase [Pseudomonadales bacterium]|jgi:D-erythrose 4-phosphate dehydrogenase
MPVKLAINGYGRIGRSVLRALVESGYQDRMQIVAINELADCKTIAHLTKYDSTHGRFPGEVSTSDGVLTVNGQNIAVFHQENITELDWAALDVDVVLECSGAFSDRATAELHLRQGAKRVVFSQPATTDVDATIVWGVNQYSLKSSDKIISTGSCTTNAIVPVIKALDDDFGIDCGVITTIHSAMNDQPVIDAYHNTDLRKTRSAIQSIIPVDTGLAKGIGRILPTLADRFEAQAMRVPTINVSSIDLSVVVKQSTTAEIVNQRLQAAAEQQFNGVLGLTNELLASCDFNHDARSAIVDASQTRVAGTNLVKVLTWFDNEWAYANRMLDVVNYWQSI